MRFARGIEGVRPRRGFTVVELLVTISVIALLVGVLLPAISEARDQSRQSLSSTNLRNLAVAHAAYAAEWNDRQLTMVYDNISNLGDSSGPAYEAYYLLRNSDGAASRHPPVDLGLTRDGWNYAFFNAPGQIGNHGLTQPIVFRGSDGIPYFGSFRIPNCTAFNQYVDGHFYNPVFYAPKDRIVVDRVEHAPNGMNCFNDDPSPYCITGGSPAWCSYVMSPAAMYNPEVFANEDAGGFRHPFSIPAGFRSPPMSQALYPSLKTHMLEHHWLQNRRQECNPAFETGHYWCQPYFFCSSWASAPVTLFYDGHVEAVGVRETMRADGRHAMQAGFGLWSRDTTFGEDGYYIETAYDQAATSFHVLTTDGIRGRDIIAD